MSDPKLYVNNDVNRAYQATLNGNPYPITSGTIDVWNPSDTKVVTAQAVTVAGTIATYQVPATANLVSGPYKVEVSLVYANSQGTLTIHDDYTLIAVYP